MLPQYVLKITAANQYILEVPTVHHTLPGPVSIKLELFVVVSLQFAISHFTHLRPRLQNPAVMPPTQFNRAKKKLSGVNLADLKHRIIIFGVLNQQRCNILLSVCSKLNMYDKLFTVAEYAVISPLQYSTSSY